MPAVEYLDPEIANEGESANNFVPGAAGSAWMNAPDAAAEEYQPDIEPPHISDYAHLKKHKHFRQYFRPYRYQPFPSWMYHPTLEAKIVKTKEEVIALGPEWSHTPLKPRIDMTGKSLPVKSDTQRLTEALVAGLVKEQPKGSANDPASIAAIVAAVMAAVSQQSAPAKPAQPDPEALMPEQPALDAEGAGLGAPIVDEKAERIALLELAEKENVKLDGRWSNSKIKQALGL